MESVLKYIFSTQFIVAVLRMSTPLILCSMGVLLVRKSRLLHRACRRHAVRFGENRRAALRHTGRLRPADRYFCFP